MRLVRLARRIPRDVWLFLAMMVLLVPARILHTSHIHGMFVDGGYYTEVASHVRDGDGLATNVSLYHFGYRYFPHPTSVYPLWPWILGIGARFVDLELLAHWLPLLFSFVAVTAAFLFGRRLWPEPLYPDHVPGLHAGHLFALGLAVHSEFVAFTSLPYTEGLCWALIFLFMWRVAAKGPDLSIPWAAEMGVWMGLLYLSRFQLLVAPIAMACATAVRLALGPDRGRVLVHGVVALAVAGLFIGGWFLHIREFVPEAGLGSLLRFDQNRANDLLHPVDVIVENTGPFDFLLDRAFGVIVAWDPVSSASYSPAFHTLHWALAFALPLLAVAGAQSVARRGVAAILADLRRPEVARWWLILAFAIGGLLSIHAIHKHYYGAWYFTKRQGLLSLPAFVLALAWLLRQPRPLARVLGTVVLCSTLVLGIHAVLVEVAETDGELRGNGDRQLPLVTWLRERADEDGGLIVAMDATIVQRVAWRTTNVGYHWIDEPTTYEDLRLITDELGAQFVIFKDEAVKEDDWVLFGEDKDRLRRGFARMSKAPEGFVFYTRRSPEEEARREAEAAAAAAEDESVSETP